MDLATGFHLNISDYDYHNNLDSLSSHGAMDLLYSPYVYCKKYIEKSVVKKESKALDDGSKIHAAILEPNRLKVKPNVDGRTKDGKDKNKAFMDELKPSDIAISVEERESFDKIVDSIKNHKIANELLFESKGDNEIVGFVKTPGGACYRIKCDRLLSDKIIDVKTTQSRSMKSFANDCINYQYLFQACFYQRIVSLIDKSGSFREFLIVAINKDDPYEIDVYKIPQAAIDTQTHKLIKALNLYRDGKTNNNWPRKSNEIKELELPNWFYNQAGDL